MEISEETLRSLKAEYEDNGYEVARMATSHGYLDFSEYKTCYWSLGAIALRHGCFITSWDPDRSSPRLYFEKMEVVEETETATIERTVVRPATRVVTTGADLPDGPIEAVVEERVVEGE